MIRTATMLCLGALIIGGGAACDRSKLTASHGRAYREAFARQNANPGAGSKPNLNKTVEGLDSQEAAIVAKTYRKNLAPRDDEAGRGQLLYSSPRAAQADGANLPPPSVPTEK